MRHDIGVRLSELEPIVREARDLESVLAGLEDKREPVVVLPARRGACDERSAAAPQA